MRFICMLLVAFIVIGIMFGVVYKIPGGDVIMPLKFNNVKFALEDVTASVDEYRYDLRYFELLFFVLGSYFNSSTSQGINFSEEVLYFSELNSYGFYLFYDDVQTIGPEAKLVSCDTNNYNKAVDRRNTLVSGFASAIAISNWNIYNRWELLEDVLGAVKLIAFVTSSVVVALGGLVQLAWDQIVVVISLVTVPFKLTGFISSY